jgi:hypothetical protein
MFTEKEKVMSHPDPCYDPDNSYEDDMDYDDCDNFYDDDCDIYDNGYDDSMDGDHDSAMTSCGWGTDEDYGYFGEDDGGDIYDYREDFHSDDGCGFYDDGE